MKKVLALIIALAMVLMVSAAFAKTITITPPTDVDPNGTNTYTFYKVFDAVTSDAGISYKLLPGKTTAPDGFTVDDAGNVYLGTVSDTATGASGEIEILVGTNKKYLTPQTAELTATQIAAIAAYVTDQGLTGATATSTGTADAVYTVPSDGYYYITTTTGTTITVDSTTADNVNVKDKNKIPSEKKEIYGVDVGSFDEDGKKALAQVGTDVDYKVTFKIEKGAKGYQFHDTMSSGLQYNNDVKITVDGTEVASSADTWTTKTVEGETITIVFADAYVAQHIDETVVITYSAKITSDALQTVPGKNTVKLTYGENSQYSSVPDETEVYNAKFSVIKQDGKGKALAGAGFVIKNSANKYYTLTTVDGVPTVVWVDSIDDADVHTSGEDGKVPAFTGLADGTYTLIEHVIPAGYNKAADSTFTIAAHDYENTNLTQEATVINNAGAELPETGGIGTTIFYVVGGLLVIGAAVILVARRKAEAK